MQLPSLAVLATYPIPNYVNPETRGPDLLLTNCVMFSVASVVVALRIYTRVFISRCFGADDVFILLALIWAIGITAMAAYTFIVHGGTRHVWDVELSTIPALLKLSLATKLLFGNSVTFVKISMLLLTRKIMGNGNKTLRNIIHFALFFVAAGNVSYTLVELFKCNPISAQWTISFKRQNCINDHAHTLSASIINVISDFLVVLIPIPVVLKLKMKSRQRAIVIALFGAGFAVCIVGIVRIVLTETKAGSDFTWNLAPVYITGAVELYVGIICASIPPTRAFFTLYTPKFISIASSSTDSSSHSRSRSLGNRIFGRDVEKAIPLSDVSSSSNGGSIKAPIVASRFSTHWEDAAASNKKDGNTVQITVGVERDQSLRSVDTAASVRDRDEQPPRQQVWRGGKGPRGDEVHRVESQTSLIGRGV